MTRELLRTARECNSCGYLTIHPLMYCTRCPGRFAPVIITKDEYLKRMAIFRSLEDMENQSHNRGGKEQLN